MDGYLEALTEPEHAREAPSFVSLARQVRPTPSQFLTYSEALMGGVDPEIRHEFDSGFARYVALMVSLHKDLEPGFFAIKRMGRIRTGFGSAFEPKFLVRIEGSTAAADDDLILEAKEVRDLSGISCVDVGPSADAGRIVINQSRISRLGGRFLAQVPRGDDEEPDDPAFWVQQWSPSYVELDAESSKMTPRIMSQVARDVGLQLGVGHIRYVASPLDEQYRLRLKDFIVLRRGRIVHEINVMTEEIVQSWEQFRDETR